MEKTQFFAFLRRKKTQFFPHGKNTIFCVFAAQKTQLSFFQRVN